MPEEEPSLEFKEKNLSESYSVFISNALLEYKKEILERGKIPKVQKVRKWDKKINKITESLLGITLPNILIQTCDQFFETGKRQAAEMIDDHQRIKTEEEPQLIFDNPRIGIISVLEKEYNSLRILLDYSKVLNVDTQRGQRIGNTFCLGKIITNNGKYLDIVLCLAGEGNTLAAVNCFKLLTHFPTIKHVIMCGIAGGVPNIDNPKDHVRLGDIVVSDKTGIINYDYMKVKSYILHEEEQKFDNHRPDAFLLQLIKYFKADISLLAKKGEEMPWKKYITKGQTDLNIERPTEDVLRFFKSTLEQKDFLKVIFQEIDKKPDITTNELFRKLKGTMERVEHPYQEDRKLNEPLVFFGPIGSANIVLKDEILRDKLLLKYGLKAVEMESAGIVDATWTEGAGYLTIRGICDYCNLDKNDDWQEYAALVAASFTRSLLDMIDLNES